MYEFYMGTKIYYGSGCHTNISSILKDNGWSNVGIVVDHNIVDSDSIKGMITTLNTISNNVVVSFCTISEPTYDFLDSIRGDFENKDIQVVVGIGGGSSLDVAKAIAVLVNNKKPSIEYRGFNKMTEPVLPIIAIPTTAGTGSEVTPNASFIDLNEKRKMGINGEAVRPKYAILDPELTITCPQSPTISAGIDSIVHAVEAFVANKTNPMAQLFAKEGFKHVFLNLPHVIKEPQNINYREKVMYGAFLAGVALMNSGTGPAAAMSYPLGVHFKVPHGIGGGIFLPYVMEHNVKNGYYNYAELYDVLPYSPCTSEQDKAKALVNKVFSLWDELKIPNDLNKLGLGSDFADKFVKETMDLKGALDQNPIPFYQDEIKSVLSRLKLQ